MNKLQILKNLTLLLVFLLFIMPIHAQKKKDLLRLRINSITETYEDVEDGMKAVKANYTRFDRNAEVVEEIIYDKEGKMESHLLFEYDAKGVKKKETSLNSKGQKVKTTEFEYNSDGEKIREIELNAKGQKEKTVEYKYVNGMRTERTILLPNGKVKSKRKYVYEYQQ